MAYRDFEISITEEAVDIRHIPSVSSPHGKLIGLITSIVTIAVLICALLFVPGKYGNPSMWSDIVTHSSTDSVVVGLVLLLFFVALMGWWEYRLTPAAWPTDEIFHCDKKAISVRRIPWSDFSNRKWETYTYPLSDTSNIQFAAIAYMRSSTYRGLRFQACGKQHSILAGLEAPEAKQILLGLRALGADVQIDPELDKRIQETLMYRCGDTSWMDRRWMDSEKK